MNMTQYELHNDRGDRVLVNGKRIAFVSTDDGVKPRWIELSVFERDAGGYVYHTIGASIVYHALNGCTTGVVKNSESVDFEDLQPCDRCKPSQKDQDIRVETDIHNVVLCDTIEDVARAVYVHKNGRSTLTAPGRQILEQLPLQTQTVTL